MKKLLITICLAFISVSVFSQYELVEKVDRVGDELVIPYAKYELNNGLTVIVHEDNSDPIVHVDVTYHVGSAREEIGKSGFAHFFEHMMFQGSDNVADEEHFKIVSDAGGTLNGTTNRDRTNYFETVPSNQLETALWLEADRMGFLLDAVTQKKFEIQRATVKNERGQNYDNRPYGLVREYVAKNLFPYGHPYSWLTIGYLKDLDRGTLDDLKDFFLRWYGPNNAVLTIAGDVDVEDTMRKVAKYFGSIPRGPEVKDMKLPLPELKSDRYVSYTDNYAQVPQINIVWPSIPRYHPDEAPLDALAEIIGQGKNSILYKSLVKTRKAMFASAWNSCSELAGEFTLVARVFPGNELSDIEEELRASFKEFEEKGVDPEALERFKASYESSFIRGLRSVGSFGGKASVLATYETFAGDANYLAKDMARYRNVTADDVMRVYNKYIKNKSSVILSVLTKKGQEAAAADDNYEIDTTKYNAPDYGYKGLKYAKAKDNFDRSKRPAPGPNPAVKVPEFAKKSFKNGIDILRTNYNETPEVILALSFDGGHYLSANAMDKAGITGLFSSMMNEGTQNYSAEEFSGELDKLGSSIYVQAGNESVVFVVEALKHKLRPTLALLEEKLMRPAFKQEDLERHKKSQIQGIINSKKNPGSVASNVYNKVLYGKDDIRAVPFSGTEETVNSITLKDIENYYKSNISPSVASLVIVGDIDKKLLKKDLKFLKKWKGKSVNIPKLSTPDDIMRTVLYLVDIPDAAQSQIRIGYTHDMTYDALGEYYKSTLMNYPLGGAFNSRINLNLREDKGWTYGARSGFSASKIPGKFTASAGVKRNATDSSIIEFMNEVKGYHTKGITYDELDFMKNSIGQSKARKYETPYQKLSLLGNVLEYDLPEDFAEKQEKILQSITKEEVDKLAREKLDPEKMLIVTVGDKKTILPGLKELGYPIVELDADGNAKAVSN